MKKTLFLLFLLFSFTVSGCSFMLDKPSDNQIIKDFKGSLLNDEYEIINVEVKGVVIDNIFAWAFVDYKYKYKRDVAINSTHDKKWIQKNVDHLRLQGANDNVISRFIEEYSPKTLARKDEIRTKEASFGKCPYYIKTDRGWKNISFEDYVLFNEQVKGK